MTRQEANAYLCIILETVAEMDGKGGAPNGPIYAAMMGHVSLDDYQALLTLAKTGGLITEDSHVLHITDKGRATVRKITEHRAAQKGA